MDPELPRKYGPRAPSGVPLSALLILPSPSRAAQGGLWASVWHDIGLAAPFFGLALGLLLLLGQAPLLGAVFLALSLLVLIGLICRELLRHRQRKEIEALLEWHRSYRSSNLEKERHSCLRSEALASSLQPLDSATIEQLQPGDTDLASASSVSSESR